MKVADTEAPKPAALLPLLRHDLIFADAGLDVSGSPGVVVHDPLRHRFFRFSSQMERVLAAWPARQVSEVASISASTEDEVKELLVFLKQSRLLEAEPGDALTLMAEKQRSQKSLLSRTIHGYLFFKVPLFNPEKLLDVLLPVVRPLASRVVLLNLVLISLAGLYFVSRQWDQFMATFVDFFSPQGAVFYAVTLVVLKIFHEFGHGFVARHFGCRVPIIGVAFMVLTPMLYTEASDAWRLSSKWRRFLIGAAGIFVETAIASIALIFWAFLPDGGMRSAAFFIATTAWIMSLVVNLSPFMRFDGYHMLSDALGMHSLGPRSFALANWKLRDFLFSIEEAPPELFARPLRRFLIGFAFATWIYRLSLFLGIAWLVYTMLPKLVGIPLAAIEVLYFIIFPITRELKEWHAMGLSKLFGTRRGKTSAGIAFALLLLAVLPLDKSVAVPAVLLPAQATWIYAPEAAQLIVVNVKPGDHVKAGEIVARAHVPAINQQLRLVQLRLAIVDTRLGRTTSDAKARAQILVLRRERETLLEERDRLSMRGDLLAIRAPFGGKVSDFNEDVRPGTWVGRETPLLHLHATEGAVLQGMLNERHAHRLTNGASARFVSEDGAQAVLRGKLNEVGMPGGEGNVLNYFAAEFGGPIAMTLRGQAGGQKPLQGQLPVLIAMEGDAPQSARRGTAILEAEPESLAAMVFGRLVTVGLRESGF